MKTFKNKNFIKRDYKCTNLVFCQSETAPSADWTEVDDLELDLSGCNHLYTQAGTRFYGWL